MSDYRVYLLECADGSYYTGITTDVNRRLKEHCCTKKGARYTRTRRPCYIVSYTESMGLAMAMNMERHIKSLNREDKVTFMTGSSNKPPEVQ